MSTIRRFAALRSLWAVVSRQRRPDAPPLRSLLSAVPRMVALTMSGRYTGLDRGRLLAMVLALAYVVSPIDVVPEAALFLLGFADDAMVLAWLAGAVLQEAETFLGWERRTGGAASGERVVPGSVVR